MSTGEILLIAAVILIPLAIAIGVTLWTLQPAVLRAERAKRARKRQSRTQSTPAGDAVGE